MKNKQLASGFTIVELLVVISIIALLVGILVPAVQKARDSAKTTQSKSNIHQVMIALQTYASDHNDRNFTTAPDNLSSGDRQATDIESAVNELAVAAAYPMGVRLGEVGGNGIIFFIGVDPWYGGETGGIAPYCFASGNTTSSTDKQGFGVWRYPNAGQVATYMEGDTLHGAYFAPKDTVPLKAIEDCNDSTGSYCGTTAMQTAIQAGGGSLVAPITSNMLAIPSSYCISPAMMYHPAVYNPAFGPNIATDPMDMPRGFKPPSINQVRYPANKTWLMEHDWLQNLSANECSRRLAGTWFVEGDGGYDGCEPGHYNAHPDSEPVTVFADGAVLTYSVNDFIIDSGMVESSTELPSYARTGGLQNISLPFDTQNGYYSDRTEIVDAFWTGHSHTKFGCAGRDKLSK